MKIPNQLLNPEFRFYIIGKNSKIPMEKKWNADDGNNYPFFHSKLIEYLRRGYNYGIRTGPGQLIIIDFDNFDFYKSVRKKLPYTFTTISAGKRCPHYFYILKDPMIKKIGIDNKEGNRVCDIQAAKCGIVAPGSKVNRRYYEVYNDKEIATMTLPKLKLIFPSIVDKIMNPGVWKGTKSNTADPEAVVIAQEILKHHNVERTADKSYRCPFHDSSGGKSLTILKDGSLYCFHEQKYWYNIHVFIDQLEAYRGKH